LNPLGISSSDTELDGNKLSDILYKAANSNIEKWADCLWTSGGNLNVNKCFCYAFWSKLNYSTGSIKYLKVALPDALTLHNHETGPTQSLRELSPNDARRTLGVFLSPSGDGRTQLKQTLLKAKEFHGK